MSNSLALAYAMKRRGKKMAMGGQIKDNYQHEHDDVDGGTIGSMKEQKSGFVDHEGDVKRPDKMAMEEDDRMLNQHGEIEEGPQGTAYAEGGFIEDNKQSDAHEMDMVGRIMKQRQMMYSKGGMVANGGEDDLDKMADGRPNNFDDLALRDDMEYSYTGANSGDELDDARENADRADIISRIMASRRKKDKMPRPA